MHLIKQHQAGLQNALDFSSEILPAGIVGSTLLDKMEGHENCFSFKHHYITQSMDCEIMVTLFEAMKQKRWVQIFSYNERRKFKSFRLDNMLEVKMLDVCKDIAGVRVSVIWGNLRQLSLR